MTLSHSTSVVLTGVLVFAATIWVGGLVTIAVVARVASATLLPAARVDLFRGLGRVYGVVGTGALAVGYGAGAALLYGRRWDGLLTWTVVVAAALAGSLGAGIVQARRMTRLRHRALDAAAEPDLRRYVRRGAQRAAALRGLVGALSIALLALGVAVGA